MKAADYVDIGHYLRDVRESLKVTVEQAAVILHIRPKYLYDLEKGDLSNMPGKAYIRGYIKNYAEYLMLDPAEVMAEYEKLFDGRAQKFFVPDNVTNHHVPSRGILWVSLIGVAALYGYWYFSVYDHTVVQNDVGETPLERETPKMSKQWEACLSSDDIGCFMELTGKSYIPVAKLPDVVISNEETP